MSPSDPLGSISFLDAIAAEVRADLSPGAFPADGAIAPADGFSGDLPRSVELISGVESGQCLVGEFPPQPATFRGRLGRTLVGLVRRALFWHTPVIQGFQRAVAAAVREQGEALTRLARTQQNRVVHQQRTLDGLSAKLEVVREELRLAVEAPSFAARIRDLEDQLLRQRSLVENALHQSEEMSNCLNSINGMLAAQEHRLAEILQSVDTVKDDLETERGARDILAGQIPSLREQLTASTQSVRELDQFTRSTRAEMMLVERRLSRLFEEAPNQAASVAKTAEDRSWQLLSDVQYIEFESLFRGSQEEIKERAQVYLPRIQQLGLGSTEMPIVDIGCGRGEWLDVMRENRLLAYGVDSNAAMTATCREKELVVEEGDGLEHLKALPANSLGAVTAFHVVEHLPLDVLMAFIDEVLRVLKPGGLALFETPNPDNLVVGACTFYLDPTHKRPLPSGLLRFLMLSRGFSQIEVLPLHPSPESLPVDGSGDLAASRVLNEKLFGCQDYAVMAVKV